MVKFLLLFVCLAAAVSIIFAQCNVERARPFFKRAVYEFSCELVTRVAQDTDNHFVSSPFSLWTLITIASLAASGQTLSEIKRVLNHPHTCFTRKYLDIVKEVVVQDQDVTIEKSSAMFIHSPNMQLDPGLRNTIVKANICEINSMPFDNFESAAAAINEYVSLNTHGNIEEIVTAGDLEGVFLLLVDALYFKGNWKIPFLTSETEVSPFYDDKGRQIGDVNSMFVTGNFHTLSIDAVKANILELPYGKTGRFSMLIFLPKQNVPVSSVLDNLKKISLGSIFIMFTQDIAEPVAVQIPRFKMSSDLENLKELLIDMGLTLMFDRNKAEFPLLSDYSLYISNLIQKAELEVNEEGTTASAVSAAEFSSRNMPMEFTVNKPFVFMIVDKTNEIPLFTGAYSKPSIY